VVVPYYRRTEQDIAKEKMEQGLRETEEYNLQMQEYYGQRDATFAEQQAALQVSMIMNNPLSEN
jgi:hypothetical protein